MKELFRIRDYRLLWFGQAVSNIGDGLTSLALLLTALRLTGSTAAVAGTAIAIALPTLVFGIFAGAVVDRFNRKAVMLVSDALRSAFVLMFLTVATADDMWILYTVAFIQASFSTFFSPAKSAFLPRIVGPENLLAANSISQMTQIVGNLAGTALAGVIATMADTLGPAFLIDAGSFIVSLAAIAAIRTPASPERAEIPSGLLSETLTGIKVAVGSKVLRGVLVGAGILMFGLGAVNVLLVPFIVDDLAVPETWFAAIEGAQVVSMVLAATLVALLARRISPTSIITWALAGVGVVVAAMSLVTAPWHLMVLLFIVGWMVSPLQASVSTLVQTEVEDELRGRTSAALSTIITFASVVSMAVAGVVAGLVGVRTVFVLAGAVAVIAALATWILFRDVAHEQPAKTVEPMESVVGDPTPNLTDL